MTKREGVSGNIACAQLGIAGDTFNSLYPIYSPLAPLGETRRAKVGVSVKVGRDRTPPLFECHITETEMLTVSPYCLTFLQVLLNIYRDS